MLSRSSVLPGALLVTLALALPGRAQTVSERYLLLAANRDRAGAGLEPVTLDPQLGAAARRHALAMAQHGEISHQFPGESDLVARIAASGAHVSRVTENVADGPNAPLLQELWMNSPGHRANLLDRAVNAVGIAVVVRRGQLYAVEDFARTVPQLTLPEQESAVGDLLRRGGLEVREGTAAARESCLLDTGFSGDRRPGFLMRWTAGSVDRLPPELTARLRAGRYREAEIGACRMEDRSGFSGFDFAVLLYSERR